MEMAAKILCVVLYSSLFFGAVLALDEEKRSHNHEPMWIEHCWDVSNTHNLDPFCQTLFDVGCDNPPHVENGYIIGPYDSQLGSQVNYLCNDGYKMVGPEFVQCGKGDRSLQWSQPPTCIQIVCSEVQNVSNASFVKPTNTQIGVVVSYTCNTGFEIVDGNTIECLPGPVWSKPSPACRVVCAPVPVIANGYTNSMASTSIGTTIEYECNEGYELVEDNSTVCVYNNETNIASWRQPLPECTEITCEPPTLSINREFVLNDTSLMNETHFHINDTMQYQCQDGYFFIDQAPGHRMNQTFDTDDVQSMEPSDFANDENVTATFNFTTTTTAPYVDLDNETLSENETTSGYFEQTSPGITVTDEPPTTTTEPLPITTEVSGPIQSITCQLVANKGVWTKMQSCLIDCWPIPNVDNAIKSIPQNTLFGSVVGYTCITGYTRIGPKNITCLQDGLWSDLPYCQLVCPEIDTVPHATAVHTYSPGEETVTFTCDDGYQPRNGSTMTCYSGTWSFPYPVCECLVKPADIVFIVDGSGSIGDNYKKELDFVTDMVNRYPYATTNFGMIVFGTNIEVQFYLNEFSNNKTALIDKITNATVPGGGTNTADALMTARTDLFTEGRGMRPNVSHIAIVITDGESSDNNATINQAELLRNEGVTIYSVGVGVADKTELKTIASNESYVYQVDNFNALTAIEGPLAEITCEGQSDEEFWTENGGEDLWV